MSYNIHGHLSGVPRGHFCTQCGVRNNESEIEYSMRCSYYDGFLRRKPTMRRYHVDAETHLCEGCSVKERHPVFFSSSTGMPQKAE